MQHLKRALASVLRFQAVIFWSLVTLVIGVLVTPFIDSNIGTPGTSLQNLANAFTVVSSVILLVIGVALYRRFSGSQYIVDRQTKVIFDLIEFIESSSLALTMQNGEEQDGVLFVNVRQYELHKDFIDPASSQYIDSSYIAWSARLQKLLNSTFLPKTLSEPGGNFFKYHIAHTIPQEKLQGKYLIIHESNFDMEEAGRSRLIFPHDQITMEMVVAKLRDLHQEILNWLRYNNPDVYHSLNVKPIQPYKEH